MLATSGCSRAPSRLDQELAKAHLTKKSVYPLSGKVLVDGQPAQATQNQRILIVLFDRARPDLRATARFADCDEQGNFRFTTYEAGDGVEPGDYVVVIAQLTSTADNGYRGPDGFNNLYNDPDRNEKIPEFVVKHDSPGKTDYVFDLKVAGEDPLSHPGSRAVMAMGP